MRVAGVALAVLLFAVGYVAAGANGSRVNPGLVTKYEQLDVWLDQLQTDYNDGRIDGTQLGDKLDAWYKSQRQTYRKFPEYWGLPFDDLFDNLVAANENLESQLAAISDNPDHPGYTYLDHAYDEFTYAAAHARSSGSQVPYETKQDLDRLVDDARAALEASTKLPPSAQIAAKVRRLEQQKQSMLADWPPVAGMDYLGLVKQQLRLWRAYNAVHAHIALGVRVSHYLDLLRKEKQVIENDLKRAVKRNPKVTTTAPQPEPTTTAPAPSGPVCNIDKRFPVFSVPPGFTESTNHVYPHVPPKITVLEVWFVDVKTGKPPGPHPFPGESWDSKVNGYLPNGKFDVEVDVTGKPYGNQNTSVEWQVEVNYRSPSGCPR